MAVRLPALSTDEGVLSRVFIAENYTPFDHVHYDEAEVKKCMIAQRAVLQNRLSHLDYDPIKFGAVGAKTLVDIVFGTKPQAISGFTRDHKGVITIAATVQKRIDEVLLEANKGAPGKFHRFVEVALEVAKSPSKDPYASISKIGSQKVHGGAFFWRTEGHGGPGGSAIAIPDSLGGLISNNRFYAITKT